MKKWFLAACLPLMIVSCDIFGLGDDGDDDDTMIVDPPRKGCSKDTLDAIFKIAPERLVYVSCDPATLARDVKIITGNGYQLEKVQPCDMFPQTVHVETIALLTRMN